MSHVKRRTAWKVRQRITPIAHEGLHPCADKCTMSLWYMMMYKAAHYCKINEFSNFRQMYCNMTGSITRPVAKLSEVFYYKGGPSILTKMENYNFVTPSLSKPKTMPVASVAIHAPTDWAATRLSHQQGVWTMCGYRGRVASCCGSTLAGPLLVATSGLRSSSKVLPLILMECCAPFSCCQMARYWRESSKNLHKCLSLKDPS